MASTTYALTPEIAEYIRAVSVREPNILQELREETQPMHLGIMQVSVELGQFMRLLIQLIDAKNILELGVFTGYSTLSMAMAIPEDGKIIACDISDEWTKVARRYWKKAGVEQKIDLRLAPALETLSVLKKEASQVPFDFIFIDADKENYGHYYDYCVDLLRPNGLLLIDNTLWEFKVTDPNIEDLQTNAIQALNQKILKDERMDVSILLFGDGMTLLRKR